MDCPGAQLWRSWGDLDAVTAALTYRAGALPDEVTRKAWDSKDGILL